uniref:Uncharacterized protein n=1 Tax=Trichobilharzia regenti TaxID=157069 RepID=A0AA85J8M3_TRIRE|nr:unnamed protein product [Trichobilharzia regenti]
MRVDAAELNTSLGRDVILQYGFELINNTLKNDLVPQLLLETLKDIYQNFISNKHSLDGIGDETFGHITPKLITSKLNKIIQPEEFIWTNDLRDNNIQSPFETSSINKGQRTVWCTVLADRAMKNALAFDIFEDILMDVFKYIIPKGAKYIMEEQQIFISISEETVGELIAELASKEYNLQIEILQLHLLKTIDGIARKNPGEVLASMAVDVLLPIAVPGPITGTYTSNPVEENTLKNMAFDVLLDKVCSISEADKTVNECLPLTTYHEMINENIFFMETLEMLKYHIDNDLADIDLMETEERSVSERFIENI